MIKMDGKDIVLSKDNCNIAVSVYCLAYNHEKYIRKTLEGFIMQKTNFNYEVIVHDDASTDRTSEIIREYSEKYPNIIKPIFQKDNQYSKNVEILKTYILPRVKGKYIAFCEGDDYWNDENKLQKQFDALESHPECSISTHKVQCCNEDGTANPRVIPENGYYLHGDGVISEEELKQCLWIRGGYPFHTCSYFVRRQVFNVDLEYPRDVGVLRKAFLCGLTYYFDEPMSTRRLWSIGNWNSRMREQGIDGWIKHVKGDCKAEEMFDIYTDYKYHGFITTYIWLMIVNLARYNPYRSKEILLQSQLSYWKIKKHFSIRIAIIQGIKYEVLMHFTKMLELYYKMKK
jgi:glycosyltransferase involved in cell wall biosynthesis